MRHCRIEYPVILLVVVVYPCPFNLKRQERTSCKPFYQLSKSTKRSAVKQMCGEDLFRCKKQGKKIIKQYGPKSVFDWYKPWISHPETDTGKLTTSVGPVVFLTRGSRTAPRWPEFLCMVSFPGRALLVVAKSRRSVFLQVAANCPKASICFNHFVACLSHVLKSPCRVCLF